MAIQDDSSVALIPSAYGTSKVYSVIPSNGNGDFTFSRSGNATRVNKGGYIETMGSNVPRLDYPLIDGVVQDCPALLLEPSRTNLVTYSEDIQQNFSTTDMTDTFEYGTAPNGLQKSTRLQLSNVGASRYVYTLTGIVSSGTTYNFSCYYKGIKGQTAYVYALPVGGTDVEKQITFTGDWQRVDITFTAGSSSNYVYIVDSRRGGNASDFEVWGTQVEAGSYATSYIPTSGSTVTRSADECTDSGTSAEFNDSEGVLFAEIAAIANDSSFKLLSINDGSGQDMVNIGISNSDNNMYVDTLIGSTSAISNSAISTNVETYNKLLVKYKSGSNSIYLNGFKIDSNTNTFTATGSQLNELEFRYYTNTLPFYGRCKQLMTFKTALTDSELETLTSWDSFNAMAKGQLYTIE